MKSYVSWIHIWTRVYQGSRWPGFELCLQVGYAIQKHISKLPIAKPCKQPWFSHLQTLIFALAKPCENQFAKLCKTMLNSKLQTSETLRNIAKHFETIFQIGKCAKACESLWNHNCENLRNLSISEKHICKSLQTYMHFILAKPAENTICKNLLQNLASKGVLIAPPTTRVRPGPQQPLLLRMVILNVFRFFTSWFPNSL